MHSAKPKIDAWPLNVLEGFCREALNGVRLQFNVFASPDAMAALSTVAGCTSEALVRSLQSLTLTYVTHLLTDIHGSLLPSDISQRLQNLLQEATSLSHTNDEALQALYSAYLKLSPANPKPEWPHQGNRTIH